MTPRRAKLNPAWANLPRRKCDNCGGSYKPTRPLRSIDRYGFCTPDCKKSFHKNGGAYRKLKGEVQKMVAQQFAQIQKRLDELTGRVQELEGRSLSARMGS